MWERFKKHHYKSEGLNPVAECAVARWRGEPIGFIAVLPQPGGQFTWPTMRGSRTVIEPAYQGLGIGREYVQIEPYTKCIPSPGFNPDSGTVCSAPLRRCGVALHATRPRLHFQDSPSSDG